MTKDSKRVAELLDFTTLLAKERRAKLAFERKHQFVCAHPTLVASGGLFSYIITPTAIGTMVKVRCNACSEETCVSDFDRW